MTKREILEICEDYLKDGLSMDEVVEWVEENTDIDPALIVSEIYKRQVF